MQTAQRQTRQLSLQAGQAIRSRISGWFDLSHVVAAREVVFAGPA